MKNFFKFAIIGTVLFALLALGGMKLAGIPERTELDEYCGVLYGDPVKRVWNNARRGGVVVDLEVLQEKVVTAFRVPSEIHPLDEFINLRKGQPLCIMSTKRSLDARPQIWELKLGTGKIILPYERVAAEKRRDVYQGLGLMLGMGLSVLVGSIFGRNVKLGRKNKRFRSTGKD